MPVINFNFNDLVGLLGKDLPSSVVLERIPMIGADLHEFDAATGETSIEFFPNRPDLYSVEGVARALRAFLDIEPGLRAYPTKDSGITLKVEDSVNDVRPYVVAAVIKNVVMTDQIIRSLMELQEKLHLTVGRKRVKVAIGVHDLDKVTPPFVYKGAEPDSISFVPLAKDVCMTMREVLEKHEKGVAYRSILEGKPLYPVILDVNGDVLSFPPIINGRLTTVTTETKNIFIDVTGMDEVTISGVLNIVTTSIAERGGDIETVTVLRGRKKEITPKLEPGQWKIDIAAANKWLGLDLDADGMAKCLARMGYSAEGKGKKLNVRSSAVRMDLIHPNDVIEDIAIGYGYENFGKVLPKNADHRLGTADREGRRPGPPAHGRLRFLGGDDVNTDVQGRPVQAHAGARRRGCGSAEPGQRGPHLPAPATDAVIAGRAAQEQAPGPAAADLRGRRRRRRVETAEKPGGHGNSFQGRFHRDEIGR